jgi:hypothetical protein
MFDDDATNRVVASIHDPPLRDGWIEIEIKLVEGVSRRHLRRLETPFHQRASPLVHLVVQQSLQQFQVVASFPPGLVQPCG